MATSVKRKINSQISVARTSIQNEKRKKKVTAEQGKFTMAFECVREKKKEDKRFPIKLFGFPPASRSFVGGKFARPVRNSDY